MSYPLPMSKRAERRHHRARLKKRRASYYGGYMIDDPDPVALGVVVNTPTPCSGNCCGNRRRSEWASEEEKLTMQERRAPRVDEDWGLEPDGPDEMEELLRARATLLRFA